MLYSDKNQKVAERWRASYGAVTDKELGLAAAEQITTKRTGQVMAVHKLSEERVAQDARAADRHKSVRRVR